MNMTHRVLLPLLFGVFFVFLLVMGVRVCDKTETILERYLRDKSLSVVSLGALRLQEHADEIQRIRGREDMGTVAFGAIVRQLQDIRDSAPELRFAYVMRRTDDPDTLEFVADADALATESELDRDGDGIVGEGEKGSYPGDPYDISGTPAMRADAFVGPVTDLEFSRDSWGEWMSAYAPIRDADGDVVGILGVDMASSVFADLSRTVIPVMRMMIALGFVFCLVCALTVVSVMGSRSAAQAYAEEMERRAKETSGLLGAVVANLPVALFCKNVRDDYRFVLWNEECVEMFGLTAQEAIGKNDYDFFPKDQADAFRSMDEKVVEEGKVVDIPREPIDSKSRGRLWLHTRKVPIFDRDGKPIYLFGISEVIPDASAQDRTGPAR